MINDKAELLAEIVTRSGYEDIIPRASVAIGLAEKIIEKQLRVSDMINSVSVSLDNTGMGILPSDLLEIIEIRQPNSYQSSQHQKDLIVKNNYYGFYVEADKFFHNPIIPTINLIYYQKIPSLNANDTNWLLNDDPDIYISALMMQAFQMANNIDSAVIYKNYLGQLLNDYQTADNIKKYSVYTMTARGVV